MKRRLLSYIIIGTVPVCLLTAHYSQSKHIVTKLDAQHPVLHLKQVQIITRHGARTTVTNILGLNDFPNYEEANWDVNTFGKILDKVDVPYNLKVDKGRYQESAYEKSMRARGLLKVSLIFL